MELQWRAALWLSSLSQKHLVPVSVRMLNISLWTWCRIAAMWSKKDRISMQTLVLHGVRKQPSACQQAQWLQCFQWKRSTFMRSSHSVVGCRKWLRLALFVLFCAFTSTPTQVCNTLSQTCCSWLREQDSGGWSSFLFPQNWLNSGISHGARRTASSWAWAKQRLWTLGESSRPLTLSPLTGGVSGNIPWTAHAHLVPEGPTASLPSDAEDLLQRCCPKTSPRCALGHYVLSPEGGQTLHWTGPAMSERHLHQGV